MQVFQRGCERKGYDGKITFMEQSEMNTVELTWSRAGKVWWSFVWRCTLVSAVAGGVLGGIGGVSVALMGGSTDDAMRAGSFLGQVGYIPASLIVMRTVLGRRYGDFSLKVVGNEESISPGDGVVSVPSFER